jgi:hypothetical protein
MSAPTIPRINGAFKWVALLLPFVVAGALGLFKLNGDVQVLETKVDVQYQAILRELNTIKGMVR